MAKILFGNFEKSFPEYEKNGFKKHPPPHFFRANFFMFVLLISNHTVFLIQFEINLHLWVFQKAEIALAEAARAISAFWKTHSCKLISNWTRNRMITYTNTLAPIKVAYFKARFTVFLRGTTILFVPLKHFTFLRTTKQTSTCKPLFYLWPLLRLWVILNFELIWK